MRAVQNVATLAAILALLLASSAQGGGLAVTLGASGLVCEGDPIAPDLVIEGWIPGDLQGAYLMVPFEVAAGTTQVRVLERGRVPGRAEGKIHVLTTPIWLKKN